MKRLWFVLLFIALVSIGLLISPINDDQDMSILSGIEKEEAIDHIRTAIVSELEVSDGKEYQVRIANNSHYTVYELNIALSYQIKTNNGHRSNKDKIEAENIVVRVESSSNEIVTIFIPTAYYYGKNYDVESLEVGLEGYLDQVTDLNKFGILGKIEKMKRSNSDLWIQEVTKDPLEVVRSAINNQSLKGYTISVDVGFVEIDNDETQRIIEMYCGSELAETRGWSADYLQEHFVVVKANYFVEYDHTKTFMDDGSLEQYFYLTRDIITELWSIIDTTSAVSVDS